MLATFLGKEGPKSGTLLAVAKVSCHPVVHEA